MYQRKSKFDPTKTVRWKFVKENGVNVTIQSKELRKPRTNSVFLIMPPEVFTVYW